MKTFFFLLKCSFTHQKIEFSFQISISYQLQIIMMMSMSMTRKEKRVKSCRVNWKCLERIFGVFLLFLSMISNYRQRKGPEKCKFSVTFNFKINFQFYRKLSKSKIHFFEEIQYYYLTWKKYRKFQIYYFLYDFWQYITLILFNFGPNNANL